MLRISQLRAPHRFTSLSLALVCSAGLLACQSPDGGVDVPADTEAEPTTSDTEGEDSPTSPNTPDDTTPDKPKSPEPEPEDDGKITYYRNAKPIIDQKCGNCHAEGQIGAFPLTTYDEVYGLRELIKRSVEADTMPPWSPRKGCKTYKHDRSLSTEQKETLLTWLDEGAVEGDPKTEPKAKGKPTTKINYNMQMGMSESWTPRATDENRCFLAEWPGTSTQYQKAFLVEPGEAAMLHHLLVYKVSKDQAEKFHNFDRNDAGYGYNCPGGPAPFIHPNEVQLIGDWVPGQSDEPLPEGVGIRYEPGDLLIFQHHYNTAFTGALADKSSYRFQFVDESEIDRPAAASLFFNPTWLLPGMMPIPPGAEDANAEWTFDVSAELGKLAAREIPGVSADEPLQIHYVGPHLHQLGSKAYVNIERADGSQDCLMETDNYDFDWQGFYTLGEEVIVQPDDKISLRCHWDNSADNQAPMPDGSIPAPTFVSWGDRTRDEMCLLALMVSRPKSAE